MEGEKGSMNKDNWKGVDVSKVGSAENIRAKEEFNVEKPFTESAKDAYKSVLARAGAIFPIRDAVDSRIVAEASGKGSPIGSGVYGQYKGIIDTQKSIGGWPLLKSSTPPEDTDHDGMPDSWEKKKNLDPHSAGDRNLKSEDGYTMLENYLNELVK